MIPVRNYKTILVEQRPGVVCAYLNRPERRNAIGPQMMSELLNVIADLHAADEARVLVIAGKGGNFCAGGDFSKMTSDTAEDELPHKGGFPELMLAMMRSTKPIIAQVEGAAMGGGLGLVAASTFAVASDDAKLGTPEIDVGLFPMMIMAALVRLVPRRALVQLMLTGGRIGAKEAKELGLLNRVVPRADLETDTEVLVQTLLTKSPKAMALGMKAFVDQDDLPLGPALELLQGRLGEVLGTDDAREGLTAFMEKRKPVWTGK